MQVDSNIKLEEVLHTKKVNVFPELVFHPLHLSFWDCKQCLTLWQATH